MDKIEELEEKLAELNSIISRLDFGASTVRGSEEYLIDFKAAELTPSSSARSDTEVNSKMLEKLKEEFKGQDEEDAA